jgi:hypothetical protein
MTLAPRTAGRVATRGDPYGTNLNDNRANQVKRIHV